MAKQGITSQHGLNHLYYEGFTKAWPKACGPVITAVECDTAVALAPVNRRAGVELLWWAMILRPCGASVPQFQAVTAAAGFGINGKGCGPAHNYLKNQVRDTGLGVRTIIGGDGATGRSPVYRLELTDKGRKAVAARFKALDAALVPVEAPKAKAPKARKAKAPKAPAPVEAPAVDAPPPVEVVPVEATPAAQ